MSSVPQFTTRYTTTSGQVKSSQSLARWTHNSLAPHPATQPITKSNFTTLSSYTWLDLPDRLPALLVPGQPPHLSEPEFPLALHPNCGLILSNANAYYHPTHPLTPLFLALHQSEPEYNLSFTDVICDRNNMRTIFAWADRKLTASFATIAVELVNNTLLLTRMDSCAPGTVIDPYRNPSGIQYGHEFEEAMTRSGEKGEGTHHRISSYELGGLNIIMRYEVDAWDSQHGNATSYHTHATDGVVSNTSTIHPRGHSSPLIPWSQPRIIPHGALVPQETLIELKTRMAARGMKFSDNMAQLWFSQTDHIILGRHEDGVFGRLEEQHVDDDYRKQWEEWAQPVLGKTVALLRAVAAECKTGRGASGMFRLELGKDEVRLTRWEGSKKGEIPLKGMPDGLRALWR